MKIKFVMVYKNYIPGLMFNILVFQLGVFIL